MQTELINTKVQHYSKNKNGEYVLAHEEMVEIERPVGPVMTQQEKIEALEAKIAQLLANG